MDKSRSIGRAVRIQTDTMREQYPDLEMANVTEIAGGLAKVNYLHWPEGQFISVPVAGSAWENGLTVFGSTQIGFKNGDRQRPFVFGRYPSASGGGAAVFTRILNLGEWMQSEANPLCNRGPRDNMAAFDWASLTGSQIHEFARYYSISEESLVGGQPSTMGDKFSAEDVVLRPGVVTGLVSLFPKMTAACSATTPRKSM